MTAVRERMEGFGGPATFRDLVADCPDRIHVVVRFLAILELYREGKVELQQGPTFGEIEVGVECLNPDDDQQTIDAACGTGHAAPSRRCSSSRTSRSRPPSSPRRSRWTGGPSRGSATGWRGSWRIAGRGLVLRNIAGGWRLYTHPDTAPIVEQFVLSSRQARLTKAAARDARRSSRTSSRSPGTRSPRSAA